MSGKFGFSNNKGTDQTAPWLFAYVMNRFSCDMAHIFPSTYANSNEMVFQLRVPTELYATWSVGDRVRDRRRPDTTDNTTE